MSTIGSESGVSAEIEERESEAPAEVEACLWVEPRFRKAAGCLPKVRKCTHNPRRVRLINHSRYRHSDMCRLWIRHRYGRRRPIFAELDGRR